MNETHLNECLQRLADTHTLLDRIQTDLRGAQEFRDAVFDLLEGTSFGAQADSTYDGLYGRLRAALLRAEAPPVKKPLPPDAVPAWVQIRAGSELADLVDVIRFTPGQASGFLHSRVDAEQLVWRWFLKWAAAERPDGWPALAHELLTALKLADELLARNDIERPEIASAIQRPPPERSPNGL